MSLALPWVDNRVTSMSTMTLILTGLLLLTATLALALAWFLQSQARRLRQLEQQLQAQRSLALEALDALPLPVLIHSLEGALVLVNAHCRKDHSIQDVVMNVVRAENFAATKKAILDGNPTHRMIDYLSTEGSARTAQLWNRALFSNDGKPLGFASSLFDITEFLAMAQVARATEQKFREIVQRIPIVVFTLVTDAHGVRRLTFLAGNLRALFNVDMQDLVDAENVLHDKSLRERIHPDDRPAFEQLISAEIGTAPTRSLDFRAFGYEGLRWIHATLAPQRLPDGDASLVGFFIDTTELNMRNETLRIARDVAERASKAKADFLATMSHEIRTPMNGVIGMLELLSHTPINAEQRELLQAVEDSASDLLRILNDILDFSKLEAGDLRLDEAAFDPRTLVDNVAGVMAVTAQKKGLDLHVSVDASIAGRLRGDSLRLRQVLLNLLSNAIKFTDRGSVAIRLLALGDDGSHQRVRLSVSDTGVGIAKDKQTSLFKPFAQAETWTSRRYGGTGLGLAICLHLIHLMEGTIDLTSEPGVGTTAKVELRLPVAERDIGAPDVLRGRHAIVRIGAAETALAVSEHLRSMGMTVETTEPRQPLRAGMAASLLFVDLDDRESETLVSAHIVSVTNQPLPSSGLQLLGERPLLSTNPLRWQSVVRSCMRALELDDDVNLHAAEPVLGKQTQEIGASLLQTVQSRLPTHRGHILVAEDHPVSQKLILRQLALLGLSCDMVDNGRDAYEALCANDYALLLTDCNMPQMSGYELVAAWREHETAAGVSWPLPIVAMTANALSNESARARDAGMNDVLSKPLQLSALSQTLGHWLPEQAFSTAAYSSIHGQPEASTFQADIRQLFTDVSRDDLRDLGECVRRSDAVATTLVLHRLLGALQLFDDGALMLEGMQLLEALHGEHAERVLPAIGDFSGRLEKLLMKLNGPDDSGAGAE